MKFQQAQGNVCQELYEISFIVGTKASFGNTIIVAVFTGGIIICSSDRRMNSTEQGHVFRVQQQVQAEAVGELVRATGRQRLKAV